jgi:hypothetical protein
VGWRGVWELCNPQGVAVGRVMQSPAVGNRRLTLQHPQGVRLARWADALRAQKIAPLQRGAHTKDSGWRGGLALCRRKKLRPYGAERTQKIVAGAVG